MRGWLREITMKVKKQHYVPRAYLKEFTLNGEHLWVFDKAEQKSFKANIKDIASGKYFYDYPPVDKVYGEQWIEKSFSALESQYPAKLKELQANWTLNENLIQYFATFIVYQRFRTREYRNFLGHTRNQAVEGLSEIEEGDEIINQYNLGDGSTPKDDHIKLLMSEDPDKVVETLQSWIWVITDNQTNAPYITSDNPVVRLSKRDIGDPGFPGIRHHLPISPTKGIMAIHRDYPCGAQAIENRVWEFKNKGWVSLNNQLQAIYAYRHVFNYYDQFKVVEMLLRKYPDLSNVDAPKQMLIVEKRESDTDA